MRKKLSYEKIPATRQENSLLHFISSSIVLLIRSMSAASRTGTVLDLCLFFALRGGVGQVEEIFPLAMAVLVVNVMFRYAMVENTVGGVVDMDITSSLTLLYSAVSSSVSPRY